MYKGLVRWSSIEEVQQLVYMSPDRFEGSVAERERE